MTTERPEQMPMHLTPTEIDALVFTKGDTVLTTSRDVAEVFEKEHKHVLRDIDSLLSETGKDQSKIGPMFTTVEVADAYGRLQRAYHITRDGFTLLAMGFTGAKALKWKLTYIEAFNAMEARLRLSPDDMMTALGNPDILRKLLSNYSEKVTALEGQVQEMRPSVQALERIAIADGSMSITEAAKVLQVRPKELFNYMRGQGCWIYRRPGGQSDLAYQQRLVVGLLEHKVVTVHQPDGHEKVMTQVRVTSKGLARLAKELDVELAVPAEARP